MEKGDRRLVIGLASALALALLVIAFLLGRGSAKPATVAVVTPPISAAPSPAEVLAMPSPSAAASPESREPALALAELATLVSPPEQIATAPATTATPASIPHAPASADQQQIAAYFNQVDRLEDMGGGDPQAFATTLVQSMSSGDFSGFDSLLGKARAQRQRLQAISPPRACVEHHRLALTLSADSVGMLERLKAALVKGDTTALVTISTDGKTLETQTNQLKLMAEAIKRQAGL